MIETETQNTFPDLFDQYIRHRTLRQLQAEAFFLRRCSVNFRAPSKNESPEVELTCVLFKKSILNIPDTSESDTWCELNPFFDIIPLLGIRDYWQNPFNDDPSPELHRRLRLIISPDYAKESDFLITLIGAMLGPTQLEVEAALK